MTACVYQCFFFPREPRKSAREQFRKSVREHLKLPVNFWKKSCPWTQKSTREPKKVPVNIKSAREHFQKKVPVNLRKVPVNKQIPAFLVLLRKKCPWTAKSAREDFQIFCPWTTKSAREKVPKSARERIHLPVNFLKKCPWTQNCAREHLRKNEVHGHFWCSRGKKKTLPHVLFSQFSPKKWNHLHFYKRNPFKNESDQKKKVRQKTEIAFNFIRKIPIKNFHLQFYMRNPFKN